MHSGKTLLGIVAMASLLGAVRPAMAQDVHGGERPTATPPPYSAIRYLESYEFLAKKRLSDPIDRIKYIPLWPGGYVSLGGQHRFRYEFVSPVGLGADAAERQSVLFVRNLLHVDVHFLPQVRLFTQLGSALALGAPERDEPPGADLLDVQQMFLEFRTQVRGIGITARAGRQEMALGSTRWVSTRDGTTVRQAFDLVRLSLSGKSWKNETFFGTLPILARGIFDDLPNTRQRFWGTYATVDIAPHKALSLELFYLGRLRPDVKYREIHGDEMRHTLGLRVFGQFPSGFEYIGHALGQTGKIGEASILAWGFAGALWQRLPGVLAPFRVGVRGDALSGDQKAGDKVVGTFQPLFPNQTFFSALPAIYPTNLYEVHPLLQFDVEPVHIETGCTFFWRQSTRDAVYEPPGLPFLKPDVTSSRFTAAQFSLAFAYAATRHLAFNAEYSHIFAGPAYRDSGGRDIDFLGTWTTFTY